MGGKASTSTQNVAIPPQILAQYETVTSRANQTANTPFTDYTGQFVAPTTATQNAGIANTNAAANEAQPYYSAATAGLGAAQAGVNPINQAAEAGTAASSSPLTGQQIDQYLSPYLSTVMGSTSALLGQQNEQAQAGQLGDAIRSGAFGGDRTGIAAANLNQQNQLSSANILSGIANQGYQSALGTAQGQQQIGLAGAQQLAGIGSTAYGEGANTSSQLAGLGAGAQTAGLQGRKHRSAPALCNNKHNRLKIQRNTNSFCRSKAIHSKWINFLPMFPKALEPSQAQQQQQLNPAASSPMNG